MPHPSTSSAYGIWSLNEVRDAVRGENWPTTEILWSVDLSNVTYDSVSFSVASQDTNPRSIAFNNDGTKMFIAGDDGNDVNEYALSTAFDLSTASYTAVGSVSSGGSVPFGMAFNNDGTKLFVVDGVQDEVNEYALSTAFDISTISLTTAFSVASQAATPFGVAFNDDGTKMYITKYNSPANVYQYSLSTGYDVSTASYDSVSLDVTSQDDTPLGLSFNPNGTKMYILGTTNDAVYQYSLTTPYDLSTASYDSVSFSVASQDTGSIDITFSSDGTKMYMVGGSNDTIYQYSTGL